MLYESEKELLTPGALHKEALVNPFISVIIPALNEEQTLTIVLQSIHRILQKMSLSYEILVVDDGSSDGTSKVAIQNDAVLIKHAYNRGKGEALRTGFSKAKGEIIVTMDADGSHLAEEIPNLINPLRFDDEIDVVIGTRFSKDNDKDSTSRLHLFGNSIFNSTIHILTGVKIQDSQCGFRAFKKKVVDELVLNSKGFEVEGEMMVRIIINHIPFKEVSIKCLPRCNGHSRIRTFQDGFTILKTILVNGREKEKVLDSENNDSMTVFS